MAMDEVMNAEAMAKMNSYFLSTLTDSEDSEEDTSQEESQPATSWYDLSIIERVSLNSVEMSEADLETAYSQIALAFRCDQYTLKQRLQAEEHSRNLAEENIQLELSRGRETLEVLKGLCLDSQRSQILQKLELCLDIISGTVGRISTTAEVLGAVHQEARMSWAVELILAHVENLKKQHETLQEELEEARKKLLSDPDASPDPGESEDTLRIGPKFVRRRVSVSIVTSETQERRKQDSRQRSSREPSSTKSCPSPSRSSDSSYCTMNKDDSVLVEDRSADPYGGALEVLASQPPPEPDPIISTEPLPSEPVVNRKTLNKNPPVNTLRQRHKRKPVPLRKKPDKDKILNVHRRSSAFTYGSVWKLHLPSHWKNCCHWLLIQFCLLLLFSVLVSTFVWWNL
ncbi:protein MRVI1 isoform X2 [Cynoglossus semilaevis]|uniref:protein MRVI1 isoform X2 n=1 Tax=Cynoglossus semilaevis TaxID=244447 RepID=UPI000D627DF8|nr:protein MRVI1-like isoform X2 [Cynoglossus semilaevis]